MQNYGNIDACVLTDTSTSLSGITVRLVYFQKVDGSYLKPTGQTTDYTVWSMASNTLTINDLLDKDYALLVVVKWYTGSSVTSTSSTLTPFTAYTELFLRQLSQYQAANNNLLSNRNFWYNKAKLRTLVNDVAQAVSYLNDQTVAQAAVDDCKEMTDNPTTFY